jgi:hypothetical protein
MNQLFLDTLHRSMTEKNRKLLESVERLYMVCEQKAQLESATKGFAGRFAFDSLDAEAKDVLANNPQGFLDFIRAKSYNVFDIDLKSKINTINELLSTKSVKIGDSSFELTRVITNEPDEKLVIVQEVGGSPDFAYYMYVAVA